MKTVRSLLCAFFCLLPVAPAADQTATLPPPPTKYFNDFAGAVEPAYAAERNLQLERFERESSDQFVVAIFRQLPSGATMDEYCLRTFNAWGDRAKRIQQRSSPVRLSG